MKKVVRPLIALAILGLAAGLWWSDIPERLGWREAEDAPLTLYGNVDIRQVDLGFRVSGRIGEMAVEEGEAVSAGDVLARLEGQPYRDQVRQAEAEVARAAAILADLEAGPRPAEIAQARALVAERQASLDAAEETFSRQARLVRTGAVTEAAYDAAQADRSEAAARLVSAERALDLLLAGAREQEIEAARAGLEAARASLALAETNLADTILAAPGDGVILTRVHEPGAVIMAGETVYTVTSREPVWVRAYIPEPDLGRIHPGMAAEVVTDTRPDEPYRGHVGFISPQAEFTPRSVETPELRTDLVYRLRVIVDDPDQGLRQGMPVTVRFPDARRTEQ
ncbi:secretion protein HlyD [Inquilinus sp. CAU 1745]|uniref:secretion protein HlyD n=1 Tax=Inquilinus sp. CAU 1745 TaxID=3140369 RepID=UPI00325B6719